MRLMLTNSMRNKVFLGTAVGKEVWLKALKKKQGFFTVKQTLEESTVWQRAFIHYFGH